MVADSAADPETPNLEDTQAAISASSDLTIRETATSNPLLYRVGYNNGSKQSRPDGLPAGSQEPIGRRRQYPSRRQSRGHRTG